ncbi:hypothetical protein JHK87_031324 [Glycine soja]|nr:hypothetical protein JHK87_031324 [Glycine soja]
MANDELRILEVENCVSLVEIVAKDEVATEEVNTERIIFQSLTLLRLWNLPKLRCIYPGMLILKWPKLQKLDVLHCEVLRFFATEFQNSPDSHLEDRNSFPTDQQESVSLRKVTPHLENLCLGKEEAMMITQGKLQIDLQLGLVKLQRFDESDVFPFVFVSEKLEVLKDGFDKGHDLNSVIKEQSDDASSVMTDSNDFYNFARKRHEEGITISSERGDHVGEKFANLSTCSKNLL